MAEKYYSHKNPSNLMPSEILKNVPEIYGQEDAAFADKVVHAAYIIPFKSSWTWYLTEYDKQTGDGFGLVVGYEPEWGYFRLSELKDLGAERLILEDFPKTFKEIAQTELARRMTKQELEDAFMGTLDVESLEEPLTAIQQVGRDAKNAEGLEL